MLLCYYVIDYDFIMLLIMIYNNINNDVIYYDFINLNNLVILLIYNNINNIDLLLRYIYSLNN